MSVLDLGTGPAATDGTCDSSHDTNSFSELADPTNDSTCRLSTYDSYTYIAPYSNKGDDNMRGYTGIESNNKVEITS